MSIDNTNTLDGVAIDSERNALVLLLTDHLMWKCENDSSLTEHEHLLMLQEKINAYISYLESEQYKETYPNREFSFAVIEIHFKYDITEKCTEFLQVVQNQIRHYGILIEVFIG